MEEHPQPNGAEPITIVTTFRHDEQGRLVRQEADGEFSSGIHSADGKADGFTRTRYFADGGSLSENVSFTGDEYNDRVLYDGEERGAWHSIELSSPGCQEVDSAIPVQTSVACRADF